MHDMGQFVDSPTFCLKRRLSVRLEVSEDTKMAHCKGKG